MELKNFEKYAVIDYGTFNDKEGPRNITTLIELLIRRYYNCYALIPKEKDIPVIDRDTKGIILYDPKNIYLNRYDIIRGLTNNTNCQKENVIVISDNPEILRIFEEFDIPTCRFDNGRNDVMDPIPFEIRDVKEINHIIK